MGSVGHVMKGLGGTQGDGLEWLPVNGHIHTYIRAVVRLPN